MIGRRGWIGGLSTLMALGPKQIFSPSSSEKLARGYAIGGAVVRDYGSSICEDMGPGVNRGVSVYDNPLVQSCLESHEQIARFASDLGATPNVLGHRQPAWFIRYATKRRLQREETFVKKVIDEVRKNLGLDTNA